MVQLSSAFRKRAQEENQGEIAAIAARLQSLGFSTVTPDIKSIHGHYDHLVCAQASGVHTPKDLASEDMLRMEKLCVNLWWKTYSETPEMSRLSMGMFVKDLKQSM